jgi:hypothetical protein
MCWWRLRVRVMRRCDALWVKEKSGGSVRFLEKQVAIA